jgi:hypothetical protein
MSYFNADAVTQDLGAGSISVPGALQDPSLASLLANYHRSVAHNYKPIGKAELGDRLPSGKLNVSPKLDGELWYLMVDGDEPAMVSPRGRVIRGVPLLEEYRQSLTAEDDDAPTQVFVSFSSKDMEKAKLVSDALSEAGIKPFYSPEDMESTGDLFQGQLQGGVEECSAVLLLLSEGCCGSKWVPLEIAMAHEEGKKIFVLCLDESKPPQGSPLKFHISHLQWVNGAGDRLESALGEITGDIKEHLRPRGTVMAGELFVEGGEGDRPRVSALNSVLAGGKDAAVDTLSFCAFDLVEGGDAEGKMPLPDYADRYAVLKRRLEGGKSCRTVMAQDVTARDEVSDLFDKWVEGGTAEGLVVRGEGNNKIFKVKTSHTIDAVVIGYTEKAGEDAGLIRSLLLAVIREDGSYQEICSCGNDLGGDKSRKELFDSLEPLTVYSQYRRVNTKNNIMYRFVRPEVVVEIQFVDVQSENSSGERIQKMVLRHDEDGWRAVRPMSGVSIHNPSVIRRRDDKEASDVDVRASQTGDLCFVPDVANAVEEVPRTESTVLKRAVYSKEAKGMVSVRKLLVWKTNKDQDDPSFPACVVHWTDFSPSRKDPLKRTVRVAPSEELALAIGEELVTDNIKKGWELQGQ